MLWRFALFVMSWSPSQREALREANNKQGASCELEAASLLLKDLFAEPFDIIGSARR